MSGTAAVRYHKRHTKTATRWAPASGEPGLAAIDNFYRSGGGGRSELARAELAQAAPHALEKPEQ